VVVANILGGLGNQMFQYATGRALSILFQSEFFLDLRDFKDYTFKREFELERVFSLTSKVASEDLVNELLGWRAHKYIKKVLKRPQFSKIRGSTLVFEPHFHYWPELFNVPTDVYLYGYWQSEKYFRFIESIIRKDFQFRQPLDEMNASIQNSIRESQSVSLHIRRGDYLTHRGTTKVMAVCTTDYYHKAINYINSSVIDPVFYIFSDDTNWAKSYLKIPTKSIYVEHNLGLDSYKDMQLMSLCKHNIIANSSFSWWGAWLNVNSDKLVVAPSKWFVNNNSDKDLIPDCWVRL
jgi:hypothetical protein